MDLSIALIKEKFDEYNRLYFNNQLGKCRFSLLNTDVFGSYANNETIKDNVKSRIIIAKNVQWDEESFKEILVHEMIHMYVETILHKHDGLLGHGFYYRKECNRLLKTYNLKINIHPFHLLDKKKGTKPTKLMMFLLWLIDR